MNFNNPGMTSYADSGSAGGTLVPQRQGMFSFLRGKLRDFGSRSAQNKYGDEFANETDPAKRRQMMIGAVGDGVQRLGAEQDDIPDPELIAPGAVTGASGMSQLLQMIRQRRSQPAQAGRYGVRGLFG
ncbi:MAG: hypothetical protein ACO3C4_01815 [Candidatus Limnocylindrus sp.]